MSPSIVTAPGSFNRWCALHDHMTAVPMSKAELLLQHNGSAKSQQPRGQPRAGTHGTDAGKVKTPAEQQGLLPDSLQASVEESDSQGDESSGCCMCAQDCRIPM